MAAGFFDFWRKLLSWWSSPEVAASRTLYIATDTTHAMNITPGTTKAMYITPDTTHAMNITPDTTGGD